ncbi:16S rRNA (cytosine(1402)-N(4))-methyltransferase RsmH [Candidatus Dependentiae bacterium]|nr:16S rRNA (cytosine(1402)-N(4))-methyltransferase RsmH [Candidatus Dependentiae bacterium]
MKHEKQNHIPVLTTEVLSFLNIKPEEIYVDATLGGGGHSRAILKANSTCKVIGIDWDSTVISNTGQELALQYPERFFPVWGNFSKINQLVKKAGFDHVHGIIADFGTSQIQISNTEGLSIYKDSFLDMRLSAAHTKTTAYDVVNFASEKELADIFYTYANESHGRSIARAIVETRKHKKISTTFELAKLITSVVPYGNKKIHPATKTFQALRIFVNKELDNIESFLKNAMTILTNNGRLICISFHSLEDRIVKQFFKSRTEQLYPETFIEILTKNACMASPEELKSNKSARSARLRAGIIKKSI